MEIVSVEARTFEKMIAKMESFAQKVDDLFEENSETRMGNWLTSQDVCRLLNIGKRTLQTYRDSGVLPFSQIGHKMFYKPEDVELALKKVTEQSDGE